MYICRNKRWEMSTENKDEERGKEKNPKEVKVCGRVYYFYPEGYMRNNEFKESI
jgi:hypothetical protein